MTRAKLLIELGCEAGSVVCTGCIHLDRQRPIKIWCPEFDTNLIRKDERGQPLRLLECLDAEKAAELRQEKP